MEVKASAVPTFHLPSSWSVKWTDMKLHSHMNQMTVSLAITTGQ